ncbi:MAG: gamma carbonic anhydrase family protein [Thermoplasmata archaeon]|nr:MAG: gamma carbonic anhydrase family protein [Thermoplasmata archaeon]
MENIISYKHKKPQIDSGAYINPYALIIGDVIIHAGVSVWPGAIIRADDDQIEVGENTAVLDRVLIEAPREKPVKIETDVLISHGAILHGCSVHKGVLIGISANILDGAEIGSESIIAAGTLVPPDARIPPRSKVMGMPGEITGTVSDQEIVKIQLEHASIIKKAKEYGSWFVANQID